MRKLVLLCMLFLFLPCLLWSQNNLKIFGKTFPVVAWYSLIPPYDTHEKYLELADAGFDISLSFFNNVDAAEQSLINAKDTGVKLIVSCPELHRDPETVVSRLMQYSNLAGYYIKDEPSKSEFAGIAKTVHLIKDLDPKRLTYVNVLPNYASSELMGCLTYDEYLSSFMEMVPINCLSFDHYPVTRTGLRRNFYSNMSMAKDYSSAHQIPFWGFIRTCEDSSYPAASLNDAYYQLFSNLAYGCKGIQYFTYFAPNQYSQCILNTMGEATYMYEVAKQVNFYLHKNRKLFINAYGHDCRIVNTNEEVCYEGLSLKAEGKILCSHFVSRNRNYLMIVCPSTDFPVNVQLSATSKVQILSSNGKYYMRGNDNVIVRPDDCLLIKL